jgi:peptidyl-prolyl cis-trans isomerase SurA
MKKIALVPLLFILVSVLNAQIPSDVILILDGQNVSSEEFIRVYEKNKNITSELDKKNIDEYLDLFINYKLKVIEAENQGYDTIKSFTDEFTGYRDQLAKPYLEDSHLKEKLIKEAYDRSTQEVDVSHILIRCEKNAPPKDTLLAYEKIKAIRARVAGGEPFEQVAKATSEDPSVKNNGGRLGYFSVFQMVYPFESAAYNTKVGKVSKIFRTSYGYHILKVNDKRPSRGSVKVAHLMTRISKNASQPEIQAANEKINKAYSDLVNGKPWKEAVQEYSESPNTKTNNGEIGWLTIGQAPDEFLSPCYALEIGQFTKPVQTVGGFHIGYVLDKKPIESYEESLEKITRQIERDQNRKNALKTLQYSELKRKYPVTLFPENLDVLYTLVDSSLYNGKWNANKAGNIDTPVVKIEETNYSVSDYAKYLASQKPASKNTLPLETIVLKNLEEYGNKCLYDYAMEKLPEINDDYKYLLKEYHDGILLFNITNDLVWQKAQVDTLGLNTFYMQTKKYQWNERITVNIYKYTDSTFTAKLPLLIKKQLKKNKGLEIVLQSLCPNDSLACVSLETKTFERGQDAMADKLSWEKGTYTIEHDQQWNYLYYIVDTKGMQDKKLSEARGLYIADYQAYLESEWIKQLRAKYDVMINTEALERIKTELNN